MVVHPFVVFVLLYCYQRLFRRVQKIPDLHHDEVYFVVGQGVFRIDLVSVGVADSADIMKPVQKLAVSQKVPTLTNLKIHKHPVVRIIRAFSVLDNHAKGVFHHNPCVVHGVSELTTL